MIKENLKNRLDTDKNYFLLASYVYRKIYNFFLSCRDSDVQIKQFLL